MYPLDPVKSAANKNESPMAPPYVDENPYLEMTEKGLRIAENEKRDAVTDAYETDALLADDTEESLDDISYPTGESTNQAPEISAMKKGSGN